ncbi:hypothetical protein ACB092_08G019100 [Castanea dentata]
MISKEQEDFLQCILSNPLEVKGWKDLVTLDSLHAFCGGSIPTDKAKQLDVQARLKKFSFPSSAYFIHLYWCLIRQSLTRVLVLEMDIGKKRALEVKKATAAQAQSSGSSIPPNQGGSKEEEYE